MNTLINYSCAFAGLVAASFFVVPAMISLFFAIPLSRRLMVLGFLNTATPIIGYLVSIVVLSSLFTLSAWAVHSFRPGGVIPFWFGVVIALFVGRKSMGANKNNMLDYLKNNSRHFDPLIASHIEDLLMKRFY